MKRAFLAALAISCCTAQLAQGEETWATRLGYPAGKRVVILHADTMGVSYEFNRPGEQLLAAGKLTSVGVMTPCPWFEEFAKWSRENPQHDVGVCVTLTSPGELYRWRPLTAVDNKTSTLVDADGYFWKSELQLALRADAKDVQREIEAQIAKARAAGIRPTHLHPFMDAVMARPDLLKVYLETAERNWIPAVMLELTEEKIAQFHKEGFPLSEEIIEIVHNYKLPKLDDIHYFPEADSYDETKAKFQELVKNLPPGLTQIVAGPAEKSAAMELIAPNWQQRVWERDVLADEETQKFLEEEGVILTNWKEIMRRFENTEAQKLEGEEAREEKEGFGLNLQPQPAVKLN